MVTNIVVKLIKPSTHERYDKTWKKIEKMFLLMKPFLHPNNSGKWVSGISLFISKFIRTYV